MVAQALPALELAAASRPAALPRPLAPATRLIAAQASVHPALALLYDLREQERVLAGPLPIDALIEQAPAIEAAIEAAREDTAAHTHILATLKAAPAIASATVPEGF